jgi:photosystem I subunit 3
MRRLFAVALVVCLWFGFAPPASASMAGDNVSGLTPCGENAAFQTACCCNASTEKAKARFDFYGNSSLLCGEDGLPHLVVDGDLAHAGEFLIPSILFLYIAGWIGWVGRSYLIAIRDDKKPEEKEVIIDVPLAVKCSLSGFAWPLVAFKDIASGAMFAKDDEITVSPR